MKQQYVRIVFYTKDPIIAMQLVAPLSAMLKLPEDGIAYKFGQITFPYKEDIGLIHLLTIIEGVAIQYAQETDSKVLAYNIKIIDEL